jgi:ArsR family transcriptional regulator
MLQTGASDIVSRLAALSQPTRLRIIEVVALGGAEGTPAGRIAKAVRCPASTLSFHLKELAQAGLLEATPDGRFIRYSVRPEGFADLARFIASLPASSETPEAAAPLPKTAARSPGKRKPRKTSKQEDALKQPENQLSIFGD